MRSPLSRRARDLALLALALLMALALPGCILPVPLSRSYDDPYNAPLPDEPAPPSMRPDEEECVRTHAGCRDLCKSDRDCDDAQICYESRCVSAPTAP